MKNKDINTRLRAAFAEYIGTSMLVMSILVVSNMFGLGTGPWYGALTAGFTLGLVVVLFGDISGAHVNPAVTLSLWLAKKLETRTAVYYIIAQLFGALCAGSIYSYVAGERLASSTDTTVYGAVFVSELLGAIIFGIGVMAAQSRVPSDVPRRAVLVGGSLALGSLCASVASSGYLNPVVAVGTNHWTLVDLCAPFFGVVIGAQIWAQLLSTESKPRV